MARREILELLRLAPGWDLYSSSRISTDAVARARELLEAAVAPGCPPPSILPMARGGIQLEWHLRNLNIEVTIPSEGSPIEVWYEDLLDRSEHEYLVDDDLSPLRDVLTMLALRH